MNLPFSLFLALKYLKPKRTFFSVITVISIIGVMLGVAVLIIVISVMNGFNEMWRDKILSFNAHITVSGYNIIEDPDDLLERISVLEGVTGAAPFIQGLVFVQHNDQIFTPILRGVHPVYEERVSRIPEHIVSGRFSVEYEEEVVIGKDLARRMGVDAGDRILVYSPQSFISPEEIRLPEELVITGVYELGMWDYDVGYMLSSLVAARDLFAMDFGVHGIQVMTIDPFRADTVAERISNELGPYYDARTWMELNRQLFAALRVERNMMFFLLIFITIVAAFGITNTLITITVQKTREIGLLKSLGFSSGSIMGIFFWQGWIEGAIGTVLGTGLGLLVLRYRNDLMMFLSDRFGWELFPKELYHLAEIPSSTSVIEILFIALVVLIICTLAGLVPAYRAASLDPAKALRYE